MNESNMPKQDNDDVVQAFIEASREEAERQMERETLRRRNFRIVLGLAVAAFVLAVFAMLSRRAAFKQMEQAEFRRTQAEDLIGFMLGDLKNKLDTVGRLDILEDVGQKAMDYFETLPEDLLTGDSLLKQVKALHRIGEVRFKHNDKKPALETFHQALAKAEALATRDPNNSGWQLLLVTSYFWVAELHRIDQNPKAAMPYCEKYLDAALRMNKMFPEDDTWLYELSCAYQNLAAIHSELSETDKAMDYAARNLEILMIICQKHPKNQNYKRDLADALAWKGRVLFEQGHALEAKPIFLQALKIMKTNVEQEPENILFRQLLLELNRHLMSVYLFLGEDNEARFHVKRAHKISQYLVKMEPNNQDWKFRLAMNWLELGMLQAHIGDWRQAEGFFKEALALQGKVSSENKMKKWALVQIRVHSARARFFLMENKPQQALRELEQIPFQDLDAAENIIWRVIGLKRQGIAQAQLGNQEKARELWEKALAICGPDKHRTHAQKEQWVLLLAYLGRENETLPTIETFQEEQFRQDSFWDELQSATISTFP